MNIGDFREIVLKLADTVSFGPPRDTLIDMAREWELAKEQDRGTDLRKKE